jgi:hypothetical protein
MLVVEALVAGVLDGAKAMAAVGRMVLVWVQVVEGVDVKGVVMAVG